MGYLIIFGGNRKNVHQKKRKKKTFTDSSPFNAEQMKECTWDLARIQKK